MEGFIIKKDHILTKRRLFNISAEGKGLLGGWSNVRGNANVYRGSDGKYYASVSATVILLLVLVAMLVFPVG